MKFILYIAIAFGMFLSVWVIVKFIQELKKSLHADRLRAKKNTRKPVADVMPLGLQLSMINNAVSNSININEEDLKKIHLLRTIRARHNAHAKRQLDDYFTELNWEEIIRTKATDLRYKNIDPPSIEEDITYYFRKPKQPTHNLSFVCK